MGEFFHEAGWPIYPTVALGLSGLALSLRYSLFPQRSLRSLTIGFLTATLVMGLLGALLGMQQSARALPEAPPDMKWLFFMGIKEASNCFVGALTLVLPACLAVGVGSWKTGKRLEEMAIRSEP
jgi:hypothetical protein